jgi:PDZ domain
MSAPALLLATLSLTAVTIGRLYAETPVAASNPEEIPIRVQWDEDRETTAVCVIQPTWFVTLVSRSEPMPQASREVSVLVGERTITGKVLHCDLSRGLCLIETIESGPAPLPLPEVSTPAPRPGIMLRSLSASHDCRSTIIGKDWMYEGESYPLPFFRVRLADSNHRCSAGTPLVNESGQLEAILTDHDLGSASEAHAIPVAQIRKLLQELANFKETGPVWVGMLLHNDSSTPEVKEVVPGSPAATAGLVPGDVVLSLNSNKITDLNDLVEAIHCLPAGEAARITVLRGLDKERLDIIPQFIAKTEVGAR